MGGFSLLEVMVAFTILALTLGVLWRVFAATAQRATVVQQTHRAMLLAESKLAELAGMDLVGPHQDSGEFDATLRWQWHVEPLTELPRATRLASPRLPYRVVVEVEWGPAGEGATGVDGKPRSIALTTVRMGSGE